MGKHGRRGHSQSDGFGKNTAHGFGNALNKGLNKRGGGQFEASARHTTKAEEAAEGLDTLESITEQNDLAALMARAADLMDGAGGKSSWVVLGAEEANVQPEFEPETVSMSDIDFSALRVPRRPQWDQTTTASQLDANERKAFLEWRSNLAKLESATEGRVVLTPFEKNLEVWRQLWRVMERSDLVVQIVDARDPLLYRCQDLEAYIRDLSTLKQPFLLLNKADMLPVELRRAWAAHFRREGVQFAFWSAKAATEEGEGEVVVEGENEEEEEEEEEEVCYGEGGEGIEVVLGRSKLLKVLEKYAHLAATQEGRLADPRFSEQQPRRLHVGLVGYPNVGKSSTINALVGQKKTMVSATPGKTKHFQTLIMSDTLMLCDCPGLVFPALGRSKGEMVAAGVLPIDRLTDVRTPVDVIAERMSREQLEHVYNIMLPRPKMHEEQDRAPTGAELIVTLAFARGMVGHAGMPDQTRTGRMIIKDYLGGKLVFCRLPPEEEEGGEAARSLRFERREGGENLEPQASTRPDSEADLLGGGGGGGGRGGDVQSPLYNGVTRHSDVPGRGSSSTQLSPSDSSSEKGRAKHKAKRAAHKFHNKGSTGRRGAKTKTVGYGDYDPYE